MRYRLTCLAKDCRNHKKSTFLFDTKEDAFRFLERMRQEIGRYGKPVKVCNWELDDLQCT